MLDNTHYAFSPPSVNCTIWRYMDFTKFLSLLENRRLFFVRADKFDDPYEGILPRASIEMLPIMNMHIEGSIDSAQLVLNHFENVRKQMFVSSWHVGNHESAAMWKLFLQTSEGIAICTTHEMLAGALSRSSLIARTTLVKYLDYDEVVISTENLFYPFLHKRLSFAHENELRAIIWSAEGENHSQIDPNATVITIDIEPEQVVQSVYVCPTAPTWFGDLVEQILKRYGLSVPLIRSSLYTRPTY